MEVLLKPQVGTISALQLMDWVSAAQSHGVSLTSSLAAHSGRLHQQPLHVIRALLRLGMDANEPTVAARWARTYVAEPAGSDAELRLHQDCCALILQAIPSVQARADVGNAALEQLFHSFDYVAIPQHQQVMAAWFQFWVEHGAPLDTPLSRGTSHSLVHLALSNPRGFVVPQEVFVALARANPEALDQPYARSAAATDTGEDTPRQRLMRACAGKGLEGCPQSVALQMQQEAQVLLARLQAETQTDGLAALLPPDDMAPPAPEGRRPRL